MQIQKLTLELEQIEMSSHQGDDKQIELLQNELDKRCDEITSLKKTFQQDTASLKKELNGRNELSEKQKLNLKSEYEERIRNLEHDFEKR